MPLSEAYRFYEADNWLYDRGLGYVWVNCSFGSHTILTAHLAHLHLNKVDLTSDYYDNAPDSDFWDRLSGAWLVDNMGLLKQSNCSYIDGKCANAQEKLALRNLMCNA